MADGEKQVMVSQRKSHLSDSNTSLKSPMNTINKPYALNIQKSLLKKLEATKKSLIEFSMTGGGLTAQADAASFELLKEATLQYYKLYTPDELECKITMSKDTAGNCVQITILKSVFLENKGFLHSKFVPDKMQLLD